jgi:hypothetical protein
LMKLLDSFRFSSLFRRLMSATYLKSTYILFRFLNKIFLEILRSINGNLFSTMRIRGSLLNNFMKLKQLEEKNYTSNYSKIYHRGLIAQFDEY